MLLESPQTGSLIKMVGVKAEHGAVHSQQGTGNTRLCVGPQSLALNQPLWYVHGPNRPITMVFVGGVPTGNRGSPQYTGVGCVGTESNMS